jgi:TRAP-type C4-dicarboxylate transport system substrate-binding protein
MTGLTTRSAIVLGLAVLSAAVLPLPAGAQETITLKLAETSPSTHYIAEQATQFFMSKAEELSNGRIKFEYYPAQQLGKAQDMIRIAQSGVTDISYVPVGQLADQLPLSGVGGLPGMYDSACQGAEAISKMSREGILADKEFGPAGVKVLFGLSIASYKAMTKQEVKAIEDFSGLKIRTASSAQDETIREFGGVAVRMPAPELYESMSRGTVDGFLFPFASAKAYDLDTPSTTPYALDGVTFGSATAVFVMSEDRWNELPADVQDILLQAGQAAERNLCEFADREEATFREAIDAAGVKITTVPPAERADWQSHFETIWTNWAKTLDDAGRPGTETLEALKSATGS